MKNPLRQVFRNRRPEFGKDYDVGWIGFNHAESNMSQGIAYIQGWKQQSDITVSHVFIVTGEDECVEAAFPKGVVVSSLEKQYFSREDRYVTFRQPLGLTREMAEQIVETAREEVDKPFDKNVLAVHAAHGNFLGYLLDVACGGEAKDLSAKFVSAEDSWICSELGAYVLDSQSEYKGKGVLSREYGAITPQMLFEDDEIFEPFNE